MVYAPVSYPKRYGYESPIAQQLFARAIQSRNLRKDEEADRFVRQADRAEKAFQAAVLVRFGW